MIYSTSRDLSVDISHRRPSSIIAGVFENLSHHPLPKMGGVKSRMGFYREYRILANKLRTKDEMDASTSVTKQRTTSVQVINLNNRVS